jgi:hypothetical protein
MRNLRYTVGMTIILLCLTTVSCGRNSYIGKWEGNVLILNIEYDFQKNNTFIQSSFAANDVLVGGGKGIYDVVDDRITLHYIESYSFDNKTNTGRWIESKMDKDFRYEVNSGKMKLTELESNYTMDLSKK